MTHVLDQDKDFFRALARRVQLHLADNRCTPYNNGFFWGYCLVPRGPAQGLANRFGWDFKRAFENGPSWDDGWVAGVKTRVSEL